MLIDTCVNYSNIHFRVITSEIDFFRINRQIYSPNDNCDYNLSSGSSCVAAIVNTNTNDFILKFGFLFHLLS